MLGKCIKHIVQAIPSAWEGFLQALADSCLNLNRDCHVLKCALCVCVCPAHVLKIEML